MAVSTDDVMIVADKSDWQRLLNFISAEHGGLFKLSQHGTCTTFRKTEEMLFVNFVGVEVRSRLTLFV